MHVAFKVRYTCSYYKIIQEESTSVRNYDNENIRNIGKGKPNIGNIRDLNLATVKRTAVQMSNCLCKKGRGR